MLLGLVAKLFGNCIAVEWAGKSMWLRKGVLNDQDVVSECGGTLLFEL